MSSKIKRKIKKILPSTVLEWSKERQKKAVMNRAQKIFGDSSIVNFLILGSQKSGTSALSHFLTQHPNCVASIPKETRFFTEFHSEGKNFLHSNFLYDREKIETAKAFFEATPENIFDETCPQRIYDYNSDMKMVVLLREPVTRAYSAWNMWADFKRQNRSSAVWKKYGKKNHLLTERGKKNLQRLLFEDSDNSFEYWMERELEIIKSKSRKLDFPFFIRRGLYGEQIVRYWSLFPRENMLIFESEDLKNQKRKVLSQIEGLLDIAHYDWSQASLDDQHVRSYPENIKPETAERLQKFYKPYNQFLFKVLEKKFNW